MTHVESKSLVNETPHLEESTALPDPDRLEADRKAFFAALGLPCSFFAERDVLVIGGSAEAALQYALWGARVCLIESDSSRSDAAAMLFLRHRQTLRIESDRGMIEDPARMARFGFVACEDAGTASRDHATKVAMVLRNVARGGVVLVSTPEHHVSWRRRWMAETVKAFSKTREESERHAREWFASSCEPMGPLLELSEICALFSDHGFTYLGSNPRLGGQCRVAGNDPFDYLAHRDHYRFLERMWMAATRKTLGEWDRADPSAIAPLVNAEIDALEVIRERVARRDVDEVLIDRLRAGGLAFDRLTILASR